MTIYGGPIQRFSKTVSISSATTRVVDYFDENINGMVSSIWIKTGTSAGGANSKVTLSVSTSTDKLLLKIASPSTIGEYFNPRAYNHNTTGGLLGSSVLGDGANLPLYHEKVRIVIDTTSDLVGTSVDLQMYLSA
jgi:hypothetical protein